MDGIRLWLVRHGATEWARNGRHTGRTDLPLLPDGEAQGRAVAPRLADQAFALVLTSPRVRARRTAELAGFADAEVDPDLVEWDYGAYEGLTTEQIRERDPGWTIWDRGAPDGERPADVAVRLDRVVARVRAADGPVLAFGHGHALRALAARWLGEPVAFGRSLALDTATISVLGWEHETDPVVERWNA